MGGLGDGAVTGELVLPGQTQIVRLGGQDHGVGAEEDAEEAVEVSADLGEERRHVGRPQRDSRSPDHLAAQLLDLLDVGVAGGLAPRVVEIRDVPLLPHLVDEVVGEGHRLGGGVVERPEHVAAALGCRDRGVQAHANHEDRAVLVEHRHAGQADVGEVSALGHVDLVLYEQLLDLPAADVGLGLVVGYDGLERPAVDAARLVDAVDGHHRAHERGLPARRCHSGERLHDPDLVGLCLAERFAPRRGDQHGRAERAGSRGREPEEAAPRGLAAAPDVLRPGFVLPTFGHGVLPSARKCVESTRGLPFIN